MATASMRFNFLLPGQDPRQLRDMYRAALDMVAYGDGKGIVAVTVEEHHQTDLGWSPTPLLNAAMILTRTTDVQVMVTCLLLPLHDPIRIAEDLAVLDVASGGRLTTVLGVGYREIEYLAHGKEWANRGKLMDECVDTLLQAWTGKPFEYRGTTVQVTPLPLTQPHPPIFIGGASKPTARRAASRGLGLLPTSHQPALQAYYEEQCALHGTTPNCVMMPPDLAMIHVAEDPDKAWAELGQYFRAEAEPYSGWQTPDQHSPMHSHGFSNDEMRAQGIYQILTPDECVARLKQWDGMMPLNLHPLVGGMPIDAAWESVHLVIDKVLPAV